MVQSNYSEDFKRDAVHPLPGSGLPANHDRQDIFGYIEMFYNPKRKHARNGMLSPVNFENRQKNVNQEGV